MLENMTAIIIIKQILVSSTLVVQSKIDFLFFSTLLYFISPRTLHGRTPQERLKYSLRYTHADLKISPYVCVYIKTIP